MLGTDVARICLDLLESILDHGSAVYVAGPLDTGRDYYGALATHGNIDLVRLANQRRLSMFANSLRAAKTCPIIDPGQLRVPTWHGADYSNFFLEVIRRYAREAWYVDGWEYSSGATKEFTHCIQWQIPCYDERGDSLSVEGGAALIRAAVEDIERMGLMAEKLRSRLESLSSAGCDSTHSTQDCRPQAQPEIAADGAPRRG